LEHVRDVGVVEAAAIRGATRPTRLLTEPLGELLLPLVHDALTSRVLDALAMTK
jgi:hypothetical protein